MTTNQSRRTLTLFTITTGLKKVLQLIMGHAVTRVNQQDHTELHDKTSSACESWDGHLERAVK